MYPVICKIGPLTIYSYGLMLAVAVVVCSRLLVIDARPHQIPGDKIYDLVFWSAMSGILGARIFFILLNLDFFVRHPLEMLMIQHGGLAWQGGLAAGALTGWWFIRREKLPMGLMLDLAAPYIALGQAIGRIGCFLNGCCYGRPVSWGIYFPVHNARLHPTQLYAAAGLVIIFFILKKSRQFCKVPGQVLVLYLVLASIQRFVIEFFRGDHEIMAAGLSVYQIVSIGIFLAALVIDFFISRNLEKGNTGSKKGPRAP